MKAVVGGEAQLLKNGKANNTRDLDCRFCSLNVGEGFGGVSYSPASGYFSSRHANIEQALGHVTFFWQRDPNFSATAINELSVSLHSATAGKVSCYRAMFPTNSPAVVSTNSAFCVTYTTTINTMTTGFPNKAIAPGCQTKYNRISSACSCNPGLPTQTTTATATCAPTPAINIVKNGGFECGGIANWVKNVAPSGVCDLYSVGDNSYTAFRCLRYNYGVGTDVPSTLSQNVPVVVGKTYILTYRAYFGQCASTYAGLLRARVNGQVVSEQDACNQPDQGNGYVYRDFAGGFTATTNPTLLRFDFLSQGQDIAPEIIIDNIVIGPSNT
ncbi:MAG: hypothetical protein Q9169_003846 [Polycauliona sp. 2 TL-2023]